MQIGAFFAYPQAIKGDFARLCNSEQRLSRTVYRIGA